MSKKIIRRSMMIALALVLTLGLILVGQFRSVSYASYSESVTVTNGNFTNRSYTSSGPYTPTSWTLATGSDDAGTEKGVIILDNDRFTEYSTNPGTLEKDSSDKSILMIKSIDNATRAGYVSSSIPLSANSHYILKVLVNADTENNGASIYLTGLDKTYSIEDINTNGQWKTAYFYIATGDYKSESVKVELWLGSKTNMLSSGAVFFDNVTLNKYSTDDYITQITGTETYARSINLKSDYNTIAVVDGDFETGAAEWTVDENAGGDKVHGIGDVSDATVVGLEDGATVPGLMFEPNNSKALFINNKTASYTSYKSTTTYTIKQHGYYKLSVYVKTANVSTGAYFGITEATEDGISGNYTGIINNSTTKNEYNGYARYNLYIEGSPYSDKEFNIVLGLGTESSKVSGLVVFDNISLTEISYNTYNNYKSGTNNTTAKAYSTDVQDTSGITNGAFNFANSSDTVSYPVQPVGWTVSNKTSVSGIINLNEAHFNAQSYPFSNPGTTGYPGATTSLSETTNNVLVITAKGNYVYYTSSNITLNADTNYKISLYAKTQDLDTAEGGLNISLVNSNNVVLSSITGKISEEAWTVYNMYVKVSSTSQTAKLIISLGTAADPATVGSIFVDNVRVDTVTDEVFASQEQNTNVNDQVTNLATIRFNTFSTKDTDNIYTPTLVTGDTLPEGVRAGIVKAEDIDRLATREGVTDSYVLMINNAQDQSYAYKTTLSTNLTAGSVYKVSVWVKTVDISSELSNDEEKSLYKGANFSISELDQAFPAITTTTTDNNGWVQYVYYMTADSDTSSINVRLGLGNDVATSGIAYFDDLAIEKMSESFLLDEVEETSTVLKIENQNEEDNTNTNSNANYNGNAANYWILIPSIVLAVVLIFAIISIALRQVKIGGRKVKVKKGQYDRQNSLNNDVVRRELAAARQEKLDAIKAQKEAINKTIEKNKADYEASIKNETVASKKEHLFSKYARTRNKLQKDLEKLESAEKYLKDESNIRGEEQREIRRRQQALNDKNKEIKNNKNN